MKIGKLIQQPTGYKAFVPDKFPPEEQNKSKSKKPQKLHARAALMLGKLDGITQLLPDLDFLYFYVYKKRSHKIKRNRGYSSDNDRCYQDRSRNRKQTT